METESVYTACLCLQEGQWNPLHCHQVLSGHHDLLWVPGLLPVPPAALLPAWKNGERNNQQFIQLDSRCQFCRSAWWWWFWFDSPNRKDAPTCWRGTLEPPKPTWLSVATRGSSAPTWWRSTRTSSETVWRRPGLTSSWKTVRKTFQNWHIRIWNVKEWPVTPLLSVQSYFVDWLVSPTSTNLIGCSGSSSARIRTWAASDEKVSVWQQICHHIQNPRRQLSHYLFALRCRSCSLREHHVPDDRGEAAGAATSSSQQSEEEGESTSRSAFLVLKAKNNSSSRQRKWSDSPLNTFDLQTVAPVTRRQWPLVLWEDSWASTWQNRT